MKKTRSDHLIEAAETLRRIFYEEYEEEPVLKTTKEIEDEEGANRAEFLNSLKDLKDDEVPAEMPEGEMSGEEMPAEGEETTFEAPAEGEEMAAEGEEMAAEGEAGEGAGEEVEAVGEEEEEEEVEESWRESWRESLTESEEGLEDLEQLDADDSLENESEVEVKTGPVDGGKLEEQRASGGPQASRRSELEEQQDGVEDVVQIEIENEMDEMEVASGEQFDAGPAEEVYEVEMGGEEMADEEMPAEVPMEMDDEDEEGEEVEEREQESANLLREFQKLESEMRQIMKSSIIQEDLEMADTYLDDLIEQVKTEGMPDTVSAEFDVMDTGKAKPKTVDLGDEYSELDIFKEDLDFFEEEAEGSDVLDEKYPETDTDEVIENEDEGLAAQEKPEGGTGLKENKTYHQLQDEEDYEEFEEWLRFGTDKKKK